jgi:hypothetical protein
VRYQRLRFSGRVWIWYVVRRTGTRWYFSVKGTRRRAGCGSSCDRRVRRLGRLGGLVVAAPTRASAAFVCSLPR